MNQVNKDFQEDKSKSETTQTCTNYLVSLCDIDLRPVTASYSNTISISEPVPIKIFKKIEPKKKLNAKLGWKD